MNLLRIYMPALLLALATSVFSQTAKRDWSVLPMDLPKAVRTAIPIGPKAASDVIHIAVGIPYRNQSQIQAFVDSVSNPASPNYRHFITPDEVGRRFGIAASQVKQVQDYLSSMGMKIRRVAKNRLAILADATVSQAEAAFNTTLDEFEAPDSTMPKGETLFSFTRPPSVPTSIRRLVLSIEGLENFNKPHSEFTLTPSQLQTLYSAAPIYHSGYQGQGRTIGITCMTTYGLANIPLLYSYFNLPTPSGGVGSNVKVVHVNGSNGNVSSGAEGEGDADIQCTLMMAPLCNLIVYDGSAGKLYLDTLTVEADANACDIITESYNVDGSGLDSWHNMHLSMSAQGITNLCAAGDSGTAGVVKYPYPDADPEVLSVGGTTVAIDTAGNRTSEIVWDNPQSDGKGVGAGGWATIANSWNALPSWQVGNGVPTDIPYRLVPDVTLDADPNSGYEGFLDGAYRKVGGTSCGSPTMAGLLADCEQEIIAGGGLPPNADGYQRFGRLQDLIYSYNGDPSVFYDVVSGSNGTLPNNQTSVAGPGWDTASGWGAMIFSGFVNRVLGTVGVGNLAFSPTSVVGGTTSTGTIGLTAAAPPGGATVMLTSASSAVIVPASVSLPAGASSATFTATTTAIGASTPVIVTATLGSSSATGTLTILPPSLSGLTLSPASVVGGSKSTGTVTLTGPAPSTGISVGLSSNTNLATVPSSVNVLAGGTSATFTVTTIPVAAASSGKLSATFGGSTVSTTLTITPPTIQSLSVSPNTVVGGESSTGKVVLSGPAPSGGIAVSLASSSAVATVPANVTIPSGASSASFAIATSTVSSAMTVTITGTQGSTSQSATLTVNPLSLLPLTLNPTSVTGGASSVGTVTLNGTAGPGGVAIALSSSASTVATVPSSVMIPSGASSVVFTIKTAPVKSAVSATITATYNSVSHTSTLNVLSPTVQSVSLSPSTVTGGASSTGLVTLTGNAPTGGVVLKLSSSQAAATLTASLTVPAGKSSVTFTVNTMRVAAETTASISAALGSQSQSAQLSIEPPALVSVSVNPIAVIGLAPSTGTVTLSAAAPTKGIVVALSSNSVNATVPSSVTVASGATSVTFTVKTLSVASQTVATITATSVGTAKTATLTINPPALLSLSVSPVSVVGGKPSTGAVTLGTAAPVGGMSIALSSSGTAASVPASVLVLAGQKTAKFTITTSAVTAQTVEKITASSGSTSKSANLTVLK